ncbi:GH92 family glycosyl hydrolase [Variovorax sp. NFACC27]|uniref:GH92 family glycosyl hydrolase n=1 Tax=unclassified Variovorax TaxID=663243 RepID=UPI00089A4C1A|nr:alpha-1,2-mannosidase, putative [Variovorax sp. NFACC28]SEG71425.1 alpha-1,2-mannosidase, putative [Variovorax sp. NFACC29]SFC80485.1 alpha-1,2-mannosidase, putative [Variovorax sp. NFACC26]SFF99287.1 alpha-1,2-mannosidase, putative [Variovorax sp. NFACC27]
MPLPQGGGAAGDRQPVADTNTGAPPATGTGDIGSGGVVARAKQDLANYVNTLRGSHSNAYIYDGYSRGNTFPATAVPFGFTMWSPVNRIDPDDQSSGWSNTKPYDGYMGNDFFYTFFEDENDTKPLDRIFAFAAVHEASPWMGNRQSVQFMPVTQTDKAGNPVLDKASRGEKFSHRNEVAHAHYYSVSFDNGTRTEITPTDHAAYFRFTAAANQPTLAVVFDVFKGVSGSLGVDAANGVVSGYTDQGSPRMYFYAVADVPVKASGADSFPTWLRFDTSTGQQSVGLKVGTSFISVEQAKANLAQEIGSKSFDGVLAAAKEAWNDKLNTIQVEGATEDQKTILYSNMYRAFLYPNSAWENVNGTPSYLNPYVSPMTVRTGKLWVNNGFWDTYRTTWPLYTLLLPQQTGEMLDGFVNGCKDGGWTTRWASPGYADMMVGTNSDIILADAYMKGVRNFDFNAAYDSMLKNASVYSPDSDRGRKGMEKTPFYGYSTVYDESVSWSLEGYLNDFGVSQMAKALGKVDDAAYFANSATGYANIFDGTSTGTWTGGWFRQKSTGGAFGGGAPNPMAWYYGYTEGNAWTYAFATPQDGRGLANLYGGRAALKAKLDAFFTTKPGLGYDGTDPNGSHTGIKPEIKSAYDVDALAGVGQYQHSNQPVHHTIYMYSHAGSPSSGQKYLRDVMDKLYFSGFDKDGNPTGDGYMGDEDNGEMSAWYVLSAMGFYPASTGRPEYTIGAPYFPKTSVLVRNAKGEPRAITITAPGVSSTNRYVQGLKLNGASITRTYLTHAELVEGATLEFQMGPNPSSWGTGEDDAPSSVTQGTGKPSPLQSLLPTSAFATTASNATGLKNLNDRTSLTEWSSGTSGAAWIQGSTATTARTVAIYTLTSSNKTGQDPAGWTLKGSNDGINWTTLDTRQGEVFAWRRQVRPFVVKTPGAYSSYRLEIAGSGAVSLSEFELLAAPLN